MAEPGDPNAPTLPPSAPDRTVDHDDAVGFASSAALLGRLRVPPQPISPVIEPIPAPASSPAIETTPPPPAPPARSPVAEPGRALPESRPLLEPAAPAPVRSKARRVDTPAEVEGASGLYSVYALILFAVPTLGVSALVALLAVTGRSVPKSGLAAGHFVFQQRTLWAAAVAALLGGILIAVGIGVFILFAVAVWLILRGASGVFALKAGRPVREPRNWFLA